MQLWKWAPVLCFAVFFPVFLHAGDLKIDPSVPVVFSLNDPGTTKITITYTPSAAEKIDASQKLTLEVGINGNFWPNNTQSVALIRQADGTWKATLEREAKELWLYLIFQVRNETSGKID